MLPRWCVLALALPLAGCGARSAPPPPPLPAFRDVTAEAGIRFVHDNGGYGRKLFPEIMGSGAAFFDANGDGLLDIFLVNGRPMPGHPHPRAAPSRLYLNRGDGTFVDRTTGSGLDTPGYGMGVAVGDVDNDGREDLYVTRLGGNSLFRNRGNGTFTDVTRAAGVACGGFSTSAAFVDYDCDGLLDLYVCRYVRWNGLKDDYQCLNPRRRKQYCDVHVYDGMEHRLFRNLGAGGGMPRFQDVTRRIGIAGHSGRGLAVLCADYDQDGWPDIFVANDETPGFLWHNLRGARFQEIAAAAGFAYDARGRAPAGMGLDAADADGNGFEDLIEADFQGERKTLYLNEGHGFFTPDRGNAGLGDMVTSRLAFGVGFLDFDLDGWPDVFIANGHVIDDVQEFDPSTPYEQTAQLFRNLGAAGRPAAYEDASAQLGTYARTPRVGRGAAFGDYDNSGATDILVLNNHQPAALLRNEGPRRNHWVGIRCVGTRSNRSGIGVRVTLEAGGRRQVRETRAANSYLSSSDPRLLFGIGAATGVDRLTLQWPSRLRQEFTHLPAGRYLTFREGDPQPR